MALASKPKTKVNVFFVDAADAHLVRRHAWVLTPAGYVARLSRVNGKWVGVLLHREIMGTPPGMQVDHINGITWDNRRANLRNVTPSENQWNRTALPKNNTSGYRGVYFSATNNRNPWYAQQRFKGRTVCFGSFPTPESAHAALVQWRAENMPTSQEACHRTAL